MSAIVGIERVRLHGIHDGGLDLSGLTVIGDFLVVGSDEGHRIGIFRRRGDSAEWDLQAHVPIAASGKEVDIEGIAYADGWLYVTGSHALRRRRLRAELSCADNRARLQQIVEQVTRNRLYRMRFDQTSGEIHGLERIDLRKRLRKDPLLAPFCALPSKENGVDIEGLAVRDGHLYLGFRGPVLRGNLVPVMGLKFDRPKGYRLRFVRLNGQGIRDMVALEDGFIILSGPVGDGPGPFQLWWWDGADQVPGNDVDITPTRLLGEVTTPGGAKAEGLALLACTGSRLSLLMVYDSDTGADMVQLAVDLGAECHSPTSLTR